MTDMNNPHQGGPQHGGPQQGGPQHGGFGEWPQQVHPQAPGYQPYPEQGQQAQPGPYGYPADQDATTLLPPVPATDDAAATTLLPPVPPLDDAAATTLLPPVVPGAMPPYQPQPPQPRPQGRHAAPAQAHTPGPAPVQAAAPVPQPAPGFDPPTMTLKRPEAPAGPPYPGVPSQQFPPQAPRPPQPAAGPRGRTGSPIIDPGLQPALITAAVAGLLAAGSALGQVPLALVVALLQVLTAAGWFRLNGMWPARQGIALAALAGFTADVAVLVAGSDGSAAAVVGTLGGFFLLVMVLQTFRPSDPKERFYALTVLGSATVVTALCTMLLLADWVSAGVGAVAVATVLAAAPLPGPKQLGPLLGLAAAVLLGLVEGAPLALGALAAVGALVGRRVAAYDFPSRFVHMTAGVALPLAVAAPLIWIATDLLA
ncbi:hypothetical protein [Streptomyces sp. NRRL WC-3742]|uniref:hypothetical protein n=1 Tax=Streptomyces sp. NRRL WC-3742 TaxID=1463934 RepID=UPI0006906E37|nr:hypothetical protein [Streptomyces sp. NRRL WC-3742]